MIKFPVAFNMAHMWVLRIPIQRHIVISYKNTIINLITLRNASASLIDDMIVMTQLIILF